MNPRRRRWLPVVAIGIVFAITALLAEVGVRVYIWTRGWTPNCYASHLELFRPHSQLGYDLQPDFRLVSGRFRMAINSRGLRGPEIAATKSPDVLRVAIVGGSSAFGYFVSDGGEAARLLEERGRAAGLKLDVINAGAPGYNLLQIIPRLHDVVGPLRPDVVIFYEGHNDLAYMTADDPASPRHIRRPVAPTWERIMGRSCLYSLIVHRLLGSPHRQTSTPILTGAITAAGRQQFLTNLRRLHQTCDDLGARLILCGQATAARSDATNALRQKLDADDAHFTRVTDAMNLVRQLGRQFADDHSLTYVDLNAAIPADDQHLEDFIHLSPRAEQRLAEVWLNTLHMLAP